MSAVAKDRHTKLANLKEIEALQDLEMAIFRDPQTNNPVDMLPAQEFCKRLVETLYKGSDPGVGKVQKEIADRGWQVVRDVDTDTQLVRRLAVIEDDAEEWSAPGIPTTRSRQRGVTAQKQTVRVEADSVAEITIKISVRPLETRLTVDRREMQNGLC